MSVSPKVRFEIFKKHDFTCQYCGRRTPEIVLELDHIIPKAEDGTDEEDNLTTSCFECNRGKGKTPLSTILKDKDIHEETVLLAEREIQLREYNQLKAEIKKRQTNELVFLVGYFSGCFDNTQYAEDEFPRIIVAGALKKMSYVDIEDDIDLAVRKTEINSMGNTHEVAAAKYLTAILKNRLTEFRKVEHLSA
jgi:hypothetical protein